ncbi:YihY/virulence factor BrkB family protein [Halomonas piscis]|uniref:YihY/virulence factor BrkB family protein n=1 Tax=Halomonas piscis TaxID=3031727 RepID=A0ABY9Z1W1_9GAMM|nr:YihY/virulence factor BrkB family protein [Halomonas piscis]WNK21011.1 YihY/virulence factor BrkB family protein [Halomonas piscis]
MGGASRGRNARHPEQIPRRGWRDVAWRVYHEAGQDRITLLAAGVAFYALLALFPAIAVVVSVGGLLFDPYEAGQQLRDLTRFMPPDAAGLIARQAQKVAQSAEDRGGVAALISGVVALFVASKGVRGLIAGLNVVYGEGDKRSRVKRSAMVMALTLGMIVMTLLTLGFIALVPFGMAYMPLSSLMERLLYWLRWPVLLVVMSLGIALLYRFAPYRRAPRWQWLSVGTLLATVLWLLGSGGLSLYARYFSRFSELYGSLGAVVVLMLWFWLSAFVVLLGAEINAQMERQTRRDTTVGRERPMGSRRAHAADTLGAEHPWHADASPDGMNHEDSDKSREKADGEKPGAKQPPQA